MSERSFDYGEGKTGENYGIQLHHNNIIQALRIIRATGINFGLKFSCHHGAALNLTHFYNYKMDLVPHQNFKEKKTRLLIIFKTKYWTTEFNMGGNGKCYEMKISKEQKDVFKKIVQRAGFKIIDSWNDDNESSSVSILTDLIVEYKKHFTKKERKKMIDKFNEFDNMNFKEIKE